MRLPRGLPAFYLAAGFLLASDFTLTPEIRAALEHISADSLRGHVSFLASDLLEGRDTPSMGLEVAAEYIAAQFRRAGLEPAGDRNYAQTARFLLVRPRLEGFELSFELGGRTIAVKPDNVSVQRAALVELRNAPVFKVKMEDLEALEQLRAEALAGKVVLTAMPDLGGTDAGRRRELFSLANRARSMLSRLNPALIVTLRRGRTFTGTGPRLRDPSDPEQSGAPALLISSAELLEAFERMSPGEGEATATARIPAPDEEPVALRNVAAVLRGSDPALRETFVLVTAHYDHTGRAPSGEGDRIFNGANDNASGVAALLELAAALGRMKPRPRRSIVFLAVFGEEKGLLGSRYYVRHPLFPLERSVANINLEQLGRTDATEGPQIGRATLTGFDYSDLGPRMAEAAGLIGVTLFRHPQASDSYFGRSDNVAFANAGIPAHTLSVALNFPDYHRVSDHWEKLDYANMETLTRAVALGLLRVANDPEPPRWNPQNPRVETYWKAWRRLQERR